MADHHYHRRGGSKLISPHESAVRLLCHTDTAGGVIGRSGTFIKHLEQITGARIRFEKPIANCHERVINVIGNPIGNKRIVFNGENWRVSDVQMALFRVFERVLEVEWTNGGVVGCRLLAGSGQIGGVIGQGGNVISMIEKRCGAKIRILPPDQLPDCAFPGDELIQIMGGAVAVKKSLVAVSGRLLVKHQNGGAPMAISSREVFPKYIDHPPVARPPSPGKQRFSYSQDDRLGSSQRMVVFRFLCSNDTAGGVIGTGGKSVKALENETAASIKFADYLGGSNERIVIISALESPEPLFSSAQIAIIRVFARCVEVSSEMGSLSGVEMEKTITARLLVASNEVSCLLDAEGKISFDIRTATGVQMQLLVGTLDETCATDYDDYVLEIVGLYESVKSALFQVTSRLRNNLYSDVVSRGAEHMYNPYSGNPNINLYEREDAAFPESDHASETSPINHEMSLIEEMDRFGLLCKPVNTEDMKSVADTAGDLAEGGLEQGSVEPAVLADGKEEFEIPEQIFDSVCGTDGSNLARMEQISGASITVEAHCPNKSFRNVIISGTLDQIKIARILLQAFILPAL